MKLGIMCSACKTTHDSSEWTDEPLYPVEDPQFTNGPCHCSIPEKPFYINCPTRKVSWDWYACTF